MGTVMHHRLASLVAAGALAAVLMFTVSATAQGAANTRHGTVVSPSGDPVHDAQVVVATPDLPAWANVSAAEQKAKADRYGKPARAATGADGAFSIDLPADAGGSPFATTPATPRSARPISSMARASSSSPGARSADRRSVPDDQERNHRPRDGWQSQR